MVNPTGYYSVSESDIVKENLWPKLTGEYMRSHWYDEYRKNGLSKFLRGASDK